MGSEPISESSFTAVVNAPIEKVDLADWLFGLSDAEYERCSPAHIAAGTTRSEDGKTHVHQCRNDRRQLCCPALRRGHCGEAPHPLDLAVRYLFA